MTSTSARPIRPTCVDQPLIGQTIAMVGASGALGRDLWITLRAAGADLVLFGRDAARLQQQFPGMECATSSDFAQLASGGRFSAVIDLATLNNHADADLEAYRFVNVVRPVALAAKAYSAGTPLYVSVSSTHAIDISNRHPYAISKREARERLLALGHRGVRLLVLPKIVIARPGSFKARVWSLLGALKPVALFHDFEKATIALLSAGLIAPRENYVRFLGERIYARISRMLDIIIALAILIGGGWLMALIGLAVRLDSNGPAIFAQRRVGRGEATFILYKFRTMAVGTREAGTHEITAASVTRVGSVLRRLKLDELPQVINILRGELSLVGPRPCLPSQKELVERRREEGVFALRPGLTGLAQVNGVDMSDAAALVAWDVRYMRLRRLLLDLQILAQTVLGHGGGDRTSI